MGHSVTYLSGGPCAAPAGCGAGLGRPVGSGSVSRPEASQTAPPGVPPAPVTPTTPPDDAREPRRHPEAPTPGTELGQHYPMCFACGDQQPNGLHLRVFADEGVAVSAQFEVGPGHQGAPGLIHGGLLTLAFDEVIGALHCLMHLPPLPAPLHPAFPH